MIDVRKPVSEQELRSNLSSLGLLSLQVEAALKQAHKSHDTQKTADEGPFLSNHLWPVVSVYVQVLEQIEREQWEDSVIAAILHDSLEDDPELSEAMLAEVFSARAVTWIKDLTRQSSYHGASNEQKLRLAREYMPGLMHADKAPRLIKLSDRLVNTYQTLRDAKDYPQFAQRYITETEELFLDLAEQTSQSFVDPLKRQLQLMKEAIS